MIGNVRRVVVLLAAAFAIPVFGQAPRVRTSSAQTPYIAEYKITRVQKLADGNMITRESTEVISVDSQGRQMIATKETSPINDQTPRSRVTVFDNAARTTTSWSSTSQRVFISVHAEPGAARSCSSTATAGTAEPGRASQPKPIVEDLGTETFNGIEAHGVRHTTTVPTGEIGNLAPLVSVREEWHTIALGRGLGGSGGITVRESSDDPRYGTRTKELVSLDQREPDESTFQPPSGYEVEKQSQTVVCQAAEAAGSLLSQQ